MRILTFCWKALFCAAILFSDTASADTTASYKSEEQADFVMEISDSGAMRFSGFQDGGYILIVDGQAYSVDPGPGGPEVTMADVIAYRERESVRNGTTIFSNGDSDKRDFYRYEPGPAVNILGFAGFKYSVPGTKWADISLSADPKLLPLGKAYAAYRNALDGMSGDPDKKASNLPELLASQGLLSFWQGELASLNFEPIPKERFAIPGKPLTLADIAGENDRQSAAKESDEKPEPSITDAIFFDNSLLTLTNDGKVKQWKESSQDGTAFATPGFVGAFCTLGDTLYLATGDSRTKQISLWSGGLDKWMLETRLKQDEKTGFLALDCSGFEPLVLTTNSLTFPRSNRTVAVQIDDHPPRGYLKTLQHAGYLYVGANEGEWGGGLRRLPLTGGSAELLDNSDPNDLCSGDLNTDCSPVTGLAVDAANPDCVLATVGLVHFMPSGAVVRICDGKISLAYAKAYTLETNWHFDPARPPERHDSVPFFSAAKGAEEVLAVGSDGIYRFGHEALPSFAAFPRNMRFPPNGIDWSHKDFVMVLTDMNRRFSISGGSVILVPRPTPTPSH